MRLLLLLLGRRQDLVELERHLVDLGEHLDQLGPNEAWEPRVLRDLLHDQPEIVPCLSREWISLRYGPQHAELSV